MKVIKVGPTPRVNGDVEVYLGGFSDIEAGWYQADLRDLSEAMGEAEVEYSERHLMRKSADFSQGVLACLALWGSAQAFKVLVAWLPAREGRRVRIRFKDGTEIEATTVKELEQIKKSFLAPIVDDDVP